MAPTSMKFAVYDTVPRARDIVTTLCSMGWLRASRLVWPNSGSSSMTSNAAMAESYLSGPEHAVSIDKANVGYQAEEAIENMLEPDLASG